MALSGLQPGSNVLQVVAVSRAGKRSDAAQHVVAALNQTNPAAAGRVAETMLPITPVTG